MKNEECPSLGEISQADDTAVLTLEPSAEITNRLLTLLQKGCFVKIRTGCSLRELLVVQFQIRPEYVERDIKVFFLNYNPVDDVDAAIMKNGVILALSAAMPGLVGAAMRKDGLSWMRSSITYHEQGGEYAQSEGVIHLKLFNQVMADLGESFLRRGVYVKAPFLGEFLRKFQGGYRKILKNGEVVTEPDFFDFLANYNGLVKFSIQ